MTLQSLDRAIERETIAFRHLNAGREQQGFWFAMPLDTEKLIVEHAMTLARLRRFRSYIAAKEVIGQA